MIRSIRQFLLISLLIAMTFASSITALGNYFLDKRVVQPYLDEQLKKVFSLVEILNQLSKTNKNMQDQIENYLTSSKETNMKNLFFQVWSPEGKLILHSTHSVSLSLKDISAGFHDIEMSNDDWRIFAAMDPATHDKIVVAELDEIRNKLADDISRNNGYILIVTYPIFGFLIWMIVGLALRSITKATREISHRAYSYLAPVDVTNTPIEIEPLLTELNKLFNRLQLEFDRNKRFAGDAAHELRTPLAALKTQAQVALKADKEIDRHHALLKVIEGVDRSSHVVAQLLTLSQLSQEENLNDVYPLDLHQIATETIAYLVPIALEKQIEIELEPPPDNTIVLGNSTALSILIRNIVDNAIRYTPLKGAVKISLINDDEHIILRIIDTGPGIPAELRERVFERFYRILGTSASGSGLGLAIVYQIAELHHAKIALNIPSNHIGLQFDVIFPLYLHSNETF